MARFPYQSRSSSEFGKVSIVLLRLLLKGKNQTHPFLFLFDTGADISSLPISTAYKLGTDLNKCPTLKMKGFEGSSVKVYLSKIKILIDKKFISLPCVFHQNEEVAALLGRAGVIDKFTIKLDGKKKFAEFSEI